ncbi:MAG: hypothetical protein U1C49_02340 [Candidatus Andersenbacteria bacterium]|nr:hypothetical protein [bacterium]MDZ4225667.1 hypothetical protein [Candidatus Andersenbacteria bacterium]
MVRVVREGDILAALQEQEDLLDSLHDRDEFPEEAAEVLTAMCMLEAVGVSWEEMEEMTLGQLLAEYDRQLQEDVEPLACPGD